MLDAIRRTLRPPRTHRYHAFRWYGATIVEPGCEQWPVTKARCERCGQERVISLFVNVDFIPGPCVEAGK